MSVQDCARLSCLLLVTFLHLPLVPGPFYPLFSWSPWQSLLPVHLINGSTSHPFTDTPTKTHGGFWLLLMNFMIDKGEPDIELCILDPETLITAILRFRGFIVDLDKHQSLHLRLWRAFITGAGTRISRSELWNIKSQKKVAATIGLTTASTVQRSTTQIKEPVSKRLKNRTYKDIHFSQIYF